MEGRKEMKMNMLMVSIREKCKKASGLLLSGKRPDTLPEQQQQAMAPEGCFWVYVGPEKERFAVKIELVKHPLFKLLLEEAETEYGFGGEGPIRLPCEVGIFCQVLAEMDGGRDDDDGEMLRTGWCSPLRVGSTSGRRVTGSNSGSYTLLRPFNS